MVGSGILFYRLGKRSESDFFLAGRGLPWWLPASSVYATHTATDTPMWVSGVIYKHGFTGLWYTFFSAWCAISAFVSTKIFRRSLAFTQAEWQSLRFGGMAGQTSLLTSILISETIGYADSGLAISLAVTGSPFAYAALSEDPELQEWAQAYANDDKAEMIGCWARSTPWTDSD